MGILLGWVDSWPDMTNQDACILLCIDLMVPTGLLVEFRYTERLYGIVFYDHFQFFIRPEKLIGSNYRDEYDCLEVLGRLCGELKYYLMSWIFCLVLGNAIECNEDRGATPNVVPDRAMRLVLWKKIGKKMASLGLIDASHGQGSVCACRETNRIRLNQGW